MKWFRLYHDIVDDPKVGLMSESEQLLWVKLLCLASMSGERGVILLSDDELAFRLRISVEFWKGAKEKFRCKGLIDFKGQNKIAITNWDKHQYDSDSSAERTREYRKRKASTARDVSVTSQKRLCDALEREKELDLDLEEENKKREEEGANAPTPNQFSEFGDFGQQGLDDIGLEAEAIESEPEAGSMSDRQIAEALAEPASKAKPIKLGKISEFKKIAREIIGETWLDWKECSGNSTTGAKHKAEDSVQKLLERSFLREEILAVIWQAIENRKRGIEKQKLTKGKEFCPNLKHMERFLVLKDMEERIKDLRSATASSKQQTQSESDLDRLFQQLQDEGFADGITFKRLKAYPDKFQEGLLGKPSPPFNLRYTEEGIRNRLNELYRDRERRERKLREQQEVAS